MPTIATCELLVTDEMTAAAMGSGTVPVCATPAVVAAMEGAAVAALAAQLPPGETTVGTEIRIRHLAATALGETVTATAELMETDGRRYHFRVTATDGAGVVAEGEHTRVRVTTAAFLAGAAARAAENTEE
ncbi:MAG: hypothetical protein MR209_04905 [Veillonellaceae bacterium]|nr:hypothetical protein [Veillonellaceae bacterium]